MAEERHNVAFVVGAVLGGLAGAALTLWRVPQPGARTRAQIAERAERLRCRVTATFERQRSAPPDARWNSAATAPPANADHTNAEPEAPLPTPVLKPAELGDVIVLPDPLEPAPIVAAADGTVPTTSGGDPRPTTGTDVVIDGPRPASADR